MNLTPQESTNGTTNETKAEQWRAMKAKLEARQASLLAELEATEQALVELDEQLATIF